MKHFGDITKLSGYDLPVVDIITGGSPCQDLSVAGKRAGLAGERSGLFMEQIRIVKEMRERDRESGRTAWAIRPRFMVWENVPGAFSSNGGKDFQAVLEEIVGIVEDDVPDLSDAVQGKWTKAGCLYDELGAWSIAWRVHDAQFWGVPQRRKRIALVADFGGLSAPEILFERKGLRGDSAESGEEGQGASAGIESGAGTAIGINRERCGAVTAVDVYNQTIDGDIAGTVTAAVGGTNTSGCKVLSSAEPIPFGETGHGYWQRGFQTVRANPSHSSDLIVEPILLESNQNHATVQTNGISTALSASMGMGGGYVPMVFSIQGGGQTSTVNGEKVYINKDVCYTLSTVDIHAVCYYARGNGTAPGHHNGVLIDGMAGAISFQERAGKPGGGKGILIQHEHVGALSTLNNQSVLTYSIGSMNSEGMKSDNPQSGIGETDVARTIDANGGSPAGYQGGIAIVQSSPSVFSIGHDIRSAGLTSNEITDPMTASDYKDPIIIAKTYQDVTGALTPGAHPGSYNGQDAYNDMLVASSVVRRLTPMECERLQGYPDGWTDIGEWTDSKGKKHKDADSPRYKALGNSIALPFWAWLARRICAQYERPMTMASLFDGIGGFPLVFSRAGAVPVWASEIEEFPIAVTKKHFPEEEPHEA